MDGGNLILHPVLCYNIIPQHAISFTPHYTAATQHLPENHVQNNVLYQKHNHSATHHNFSVPQYILVASRVQYNATGVGVNTVDMQNT